MKPNDLKTTSAALPYTDCHVHTSSKFYFNGDRQMSHPIPFDKVYGQQVGRSKLNKYYQADPEQMAAAGAQMVFCTLLPGERIGHRSSNLVFLYLLQFVTGLSPKKSRVYYKKHPDYYSMFAGEKKLLETIDPQKFLVVRSKADMALNDGRIKIFVNTEGMHSFVKQARFKRIKYLMMAPAHKALSMAGIMKKQKSFYQHFCDYEQIARKQIVQTIAELKQGETPLFSIGVSHFEYNFILGQAWALPFPKLIKSLRFFTALHVPDGKDGLSEEAQQAIALMYDKSRGRRILLDIKHASAQTRKDIFAFMRKQFPHKLPPVICSHTGVSGVKTLEKALLTTSNNNDWKHAIKGRFNPWPINMCDEDILFISESGGIIGLMLDRRLLGDMSTFLVFFGKTPYYKNIKKKIHKLADEGQLKLNDSYHISLYIHCIMFLENLFHMVQVINHRKAWDVVCFGSDFDGNIKPINSCPTAQYVGKFREMLAELAPVYFDEQYLESLLFGYTLQEAFHRFFYQNLIDFATRQVEENW
ncbi:hypothetical protein GC194_14765 [bacterium]|nr:hypothetical protein [bacterium]